MKFTKGILIGSILATGMLMMIDEGNMLYRNKKRIMKKGKQFMKKRN